MSNTEKLKETLGPVDFNVIVGRRKQVNMTPVPLNCPLDSELYS